MIGIKEKSVSKTVDKFREIELDLSKEFGDFNLFALIEREDALGKWDVVIAARWIGDEEKKGLIDTLASRIQKKLSRDEQLMLSRIVILRPSDSLVQTLNLMITAKHSSIELSNNTINGIVIKEAYLITSQRI